MLTESQAKAIVSGSIREVGNTPGEPAAAASLGESGIDASRFNRLIEVIASSPKLGVPRYQHYIDPNKIAELNLSTSIEKLTETVWKLSAGKLCSNPNNPHSQTCCPYPDKCPECGYPVL
jgi:hypothetical protein